MTAGVGPIYAVRRSDYVELDPHAAPRHSPGGLGHVGREPRGIVAPGAVLAAAGRSREALEGTLGSFVEVRKHLHV